MGLSFRQQLLLPSLLLLIFPILAWWWLSQYGTELEQIQRKAMKSNLELLSTYLRSKTELSNEILEIKDFNKTRDLYASASANEISLDGKDKDWRDSQSIHSQPIHSQPIHYGLSELINIDYPYTKESLQIDLRVAYQDDDLYLYISVLDESVIYRDLNNLSVHRNDHISFILINENNTHQRYTFAPYQPSLSTAFVVTSSGRALRPESKLKGYWSATDRGYDFEVKIPRSMIGEKFRWWVADVDDAETRLVKYNMGNAKEDQIPSLQFPSQALTLELQNYELGKVTIRDVHKRLIAESGSIDQSTDPIFAYWTEFLAAVDAQANKNGNNIIELSVPLIFDDKLKAHLTLSQSNKGALLLKQRLYSFVLYASILTLFLGFLFWFYSTKLITKRIQKLTQSVEKAVDSQGRVSQAFVPSTNKDELGNLSRSFSEIVTRLQQYNSYLEEMASRLAHELRTPVSLVQSSLENLADNNLSDNDLSDKNQVFVGRANKGIVRLKNILNKMSEATRLEQSLDEDEIVAFNLSHVVKGCFQGYEQTYPNYNFSLSLESDALSITGIPDMIAQLLDKLVSNATEFSPNAGRILIRLTKEKEHAILRVINDGPNLPEEMQSSLFDGMVSIRETQHKGTGHLGLGLYIAKIITRFHRGQIEINNREDAAGVIVSVSIPLMRISSKLA